MTLTFAGLDEAWEQQRRAVAPLRELLRRYGAVASHEALLRECAHDLSLSAMAKCLERRGLRARVVSIIESDLPDLGTTLVELRDQTIALLRPERRRRCQLELADGSILNERARIEDVISGRALEIENDWPATGSFLRRIVSIGLSNARVRGALILCFATLLLSEVSAFIQPALARLVVDRAIPEGASRTLAVLVLALVLMAALAALVANLSERGELYVEKRLAAAAYPGLLGHYLRLPLGELQRQTVGSALQLLKNVPAIVHSAVHNVAGGVVDVLLTVGYLYWVADLAPALAALLVVAHLAVAGVVIPLAQYAAKRQDAALMASGEQSDRLIELIERVACLRVEGAFAWATGRWQRALRATQEHELRVELSQGLVAELVGAVQRLIVGVTVLWAAHACLSGGRTIGELFAVVAAASAASGALMRLITLGSGLLTTRAQLRRVDEVLAKPAEPQASGPSEPRAASGIAINHVWFRYAADAPWVIQDLSLSFEPGQVSTIRWPSGRGKSTLLRLIAGLYAPERGDVMVDGLEARAARHLVAYVPQSCVLFAGSILHNLRLLSHADQERIEAAAAATGLRRLLEQWPMGMETIVTDGGSNMSSGQRQLVIFTAALASRRPILLLDEATTHLDLVMRAGLEQSPLLRGRTIINVMHFDDPGSAADDRAPR